MAGKIGGLGKGLDALIARAAPPAESGKDGPGPDGMAAIESIRAGGRQPRRDFPADALEELAESIRQHGVLLPLLVRPAPGGGYELIAGERRLRAAKAAGRTEVPVRIVAADDRAAAEMALVENLQREDLNPIEEAEGYASLAQRFAFSQERIAERVGKARATVANAMRLLGLPAEIREAVRTGALTAGHAKALLALPTEAERLTAGRRCAREGWSVRELERRIARPRRSPRARRTTAPDPIRSAVEDRLRERLGTAVTLTPCRELPGGRTARGRIAIDFYSNEDLDRLLALLGVAGEGF